MPSTDIIIKLGGATTKTIRAKAGALDALALSVGKVKAAFTGAPFQRATQGMQGFGQQVRKATTGAKNYGKAVDNASKRTDRFGTKIKGAGNALDNFGTLFRRMIRIMLAFAIISTVTRAIKEFVTTLFSAPMRMELWNKQLVVLSKNATLAAERLTLLKRVAVETPLELPDLFQGLTTLQAFNVEVSERTIPLITDLAAVSGRSFQEVSEVIGKVIAGSPTAITRSLPTLAIAPNEFKALRDELGSASDAIFQIIDEKFKGFAKESATTVIGVLSNIKDAWFNVMADIGEGVMMPLRDMFQGIMDYLVELSKSPARLKALKEEIRLVVSDLVGFAESLWKVTQAVSNAIGKLGGMRTVLSAIAVLLSYKLLRALWGAVTAIKATAAATAALNVQLAIANTLFGVGLIVLAGMAIAKLWSMTDQTKKLRLEQLELNEELREMNRQLAINQDFVAAGTVQRQGVRFIEASQALVSSAPLSIRELDQGQTGASRDFWAKAREAEILASVGGQKELAQRLGLELNMIVAAAALGRIPESDVRQFIVTLMADLGRHGGMLQDKAQEMMAAAGTGFEPQIETTTDDTDPLKAFFDAWKEYFAQFEHSFDLVKSKFDAGLIDSQMARSQAEALREMLVPMRDMYLMMDDPKWQQVGMMLDPIIGNLDSFIGGLNKDITDAFNQEFTELKLQIELGMDEEVATTALLALKDKIVEQMTILEDTLTPEMKKAFQGILTGINNAIEGLDPENISSALEQVLRMIVQKGADTISDALASIINPDLGVSLSQAMGQLFSGMLQIMGDSMIQLGIASLLLQDWFADVTNPVGAAKMIAGGILLKTLAKAIGGKVKSAAAGGSGGGGGAINYPQFSPGAYGDKRSWYVEINAMDAASFEQVITRNPAAFGRQISRIAREDRATGGQAYGAFQPG